MLGFVDAMCRSIHSEIFREVLGELFMSLVVKAIRNRFLNMCVFVVFVCCEANPEILREICLRNVPWSHLRIC